VRLVGVVPWRVAMDRALYGPGGFFVGGTGTRSVPAAHFRTSVHAGPLCAEAILRLLSQVDEALDRPGRLDLVDVGAGGGELLTTVAARAPVALARRLRLTAVELAPRPATLIPVIDWRSTVPTGITGLLTATEWLDNVPLDVAVADHDGAGARHLLVDPATGAEIESEPVSGADAAWLRRWWPVVPGVRIELGRPRDEAWAGAVGAVARGLALAIDYGHRYADRPVAGTITGFRAGRQVPPRLDGSCDITAHVAIDSVAAAGSAAAGGRPYTLQTQRAALHALGVTGRRPPRALATTNPAGYLAALSAAGSAAELTDPAGLGGHWWLMQPAGLTRAEQARLTDPD